MRTGNALFSRIILLLLLILTLPNNLRRNIAFFREIFSARTWKTKTSTFHSFSFIEVLEKTFRIISNPNDTTYANRYHSTNVGIDGVL